MKIQSKFKEIYQLIKVHMFLVNLNDMFCNEQKCLKNIVLITLFLFDFQSKNETSIILKIDCMLSKNKLS